MIFEDTQYNNVYGSVAVCFYILNRDRLGKKWPKAIRKRWAELCREKWRIDFPPDDPEFLRKACGLFGIEFSPEFSRQVVRLRSRFNEIYCPKIDGEIYPNREDGFTGITFLAGKEVPEQGGENGDE